MRRFVVRFYVTIVQDAVDIGDAYNRAEVKFDDIAGAAVKHLDTTEVALDDTRKERAR